MPDVNPVDVLLKMPFGAALHCEHKVQTAEDPHLGDVEVALLIHEGRGHIQKLSRAPGIETRAGIIQKQNPYVVLIPFMIQIAETRDLWETWFNPCETWSEVRLLTEQPRILLHFHSDLPTPDRSIEIINHMQAFWREALAAVRHKPKWSMSDYDRAKELIFHDHTPEQLWKALSGGPGIRRID